MILKGNQRGNGRELANHLMRGKENEHIELHDLRGFAADDLHGAMQECEAIAKGTRCKNHLFSLSLCLQYHHAHMRMVAAEADEARAKHSGGSMPDGDDEIPY